jgi:phosphohistidine phosphatase SixA
MLNRIALIALTLAVALGAAVPVRADEAAAWAALRAGGHVALMRHTDAPGGTGDPPGFRLEDCATQRNLSAKGRSDAAEIGAHLRAKGIAFEKILSSPWCRCMDTARLLDMGPVEAAPTFSNVVVLRDQTETLTQGAQALIADWRDVGALLVVTHGANIRALTGISPATGEIVVVDAAEDGSIATVGRIPPAR